MKEVWQRIEAWFTMNVPGDFYAEGFGAIPFPKGATEEEIQEAERGLRTGKKLRRKIAAMLQQATDSVAKKPDLGQEIQLRLPEEIRQSYLVHNGCEGVHPEYGELLPVHRVPDSWAICLGWAECCKQYDQSLVPVTTKGPLKDDLWNPHWIPLTDSGGGRYYVCVDLDPAEGGQVGQVVYINTEDLLRIVLAGSFKEWLSEFADELEAGQFKWKEELEDIVRVSGRDIFGRWYRDR